MLEYGPLKMYPKLGFWVDSKSHPISRILSNSPYPKPGIFEFSKISYFNQGYGFKIVVILPR